jgi:hypothetical protein
MGKITITIATPHLSDQELNELFMGKGLYGESVFAPILTPLTDRYQIDCRDDEKQTLSGEEGLAI